MTYKLGKTKGWNQKVYNFNEYAGDKRNTIQFWNKKEVLDIRPMGKNDANGYVYENLAEGQPRKYFKTKSQAVKYAKSQMKNKN